MSPEAAERLRLRHTFAAGPEEVFDAWTDPAVLARWWAAAPTWDSPGCDVDLRVGGRYVLRMRDDRTGVVHVVAGEYLEVDRPRRLVYTWAWQAEDGTAGPRSVVTVEFRADGDRTTVVLEHTGLPSKESDRHAVGWAGTFENLARRVFPADSRDDRA
jgi:uncharacterized protein YndB with AHSA1/START domain